MQPPFIFDTSSFRVLGNYYPDRFPTFWKRFAESIAAGHVLSVKEVYNELERYGDSLIWPWSQANKHVFEPPPADEGAFVAKIFAVPHFHALIGGRQILQGRPVADPFLIASAGVRGGCVVTEEEHKPNAAKIPNVCQHFKVGCTNVEGFLHHSGWEF
jgi:Domain of unknown function (DUF4411)